MRNKLLRYSRVTLMPINDYIYKGSFAGVLVSFCDKNVCICYEQSKIITNT